MHACIHCSVIDRSYISNQWSASKFNMFFFCLFFSEFVRCPDHNQRLIYDQLTVTVAGHLLCRAFCHLLTFIHRLLHQSLMIRSHKLTSCLLWDTSPSCVMTKPATLSWRRCRECLCDGGDETYCTDEWYDLMRTNRRCSACSFTGSIMLLLGFFQQSCHSAIFTHHLFTQSVVYTGSYR